MVYDGSALGKNMNFANTRGKFRLSKGDAMVNCSEKESFDQAFSIADEKLYADKATKHEEYQVAALDR